MASAARRAARSGDGPLPKPRATAHHRHPRRGARGRRTPLRPPRPNPRHRERRADDRRAQARSRPHERLAQRLRAQQGQLGYDQVELPGLPYGLPAGDRITWTKPQTIPGQARVENGTRGNVIDIDAHEHRVLVRLDGTERDVEVGENAIETLRLAYAQHLYRQQGATVQRTGSLTGGWQTTREGAYVQASRARHGTDWHVCRDDLGIDDHDTDRIDRLAAAMRTLGTQTPSINHALTDQTAIDQDDRSPHLHRSPTAPRTRHPDTTRSLQPERGH